MFHLTVAIARFFEFLLLDMAKSAAGLAVVGLTGLGGGIAAVVALRRRARQRGK